MIDPKQIAGISDYFANWNWGELPNTDEMVNEFEIERDEKGEIHFRLGIDESLIAAYGAAVFAECLIRDHSLVIKAPLVTFGEKDRSVFTVEFGPFCATFSREDIQYLLDFDDSNMTDCDEALDAHDRESKVIFDRTLCY